MSGQSVPLAHLPVAEVSIPRAQLRAALSDAKRATDLLDMMDTMLRIHDAGGEAASAIELGQGVGLVKEQVASIASALEAAMPRTAHGGG